MLRLIFIGCLLGVNFVVLNAEERPDVLEINAVSVDPWTNQTQIFWTPSFSPEAYGYIIFEQKRPSTFNPAIDTVWGANENSYTVEEQADTNFLYAIRVLDSRFTDGPFSFFRKHVFLCKAKQLPCERLIEISWSDARRSIVDIAHFEIWRSINDGDFANVATVNASQNSYVYAVGGSEDSEKYKIFVRAVSSNDTIFANSIADTLTLQLAPKPKYAYLKTVSVINNQTVEIRCSVDVSTVWDSLFVYAGDSLVKVIGYENFVANFQVQRIEHAFYYFAISDTCGEVAIYSDSAKPVFLAARLSETTVNLTFSEYYGWFESDIRYDIFEIKDGDTTLVKSDLFPNQTYPFDISDFGQILSLSYYVRAYEISRETYEIRDSTFSNVVEIISRDQIPVDFPTGFVPGGRTQIYRPIYSPQENDRMRFIIFNKFGQVVFSTNNPDEGWNGTFNNAGSDCQPGVYLYQFELIRSGKTTRKQGVITLIR